ncbi:MAG: hypothetical protein J0M21_12925, partial [Xanthomonadales bacterium]|nr:hypothetical protein [Xanthomonadales bacterium]
FGSLALTPIPPVQVFGLYVAIGIGVAWVLTITFIPAYVMFLPERVFANFGAAHDTESHSWLARFLRGLGPFTVKRSKAIVAASVVLLGVAAYGIARIEINDNPVKWFAKGHEIRVADEVLNRHFAGTYMAHLALLAPDEVYDAARFQKQLVARLQAARWGRDDPAAVLGVLRQAFAGGPRWRRASARPSRDPLPPLYPE